MTAGTIPTVDLEGRSAAQLAAPISEAFRELGFVALVGHGVESALVQRVYRALRAFFDLSREQKLRYHVPDGGGARGYTPFGIEKAKDQSVADLKEFWHVGRELPTGAEQREAMAGLPPNLWPEGVDDFRDSMLALYRALDGLGARVLSAVALGLELESDFFERVVDRGNSILRPLHYPPIVKASVSPLDTASKNAVRAASHEDINLITLLVGSAEPGLQILSHEGDWIDAPTGEELIICNVGDMLQRLTNHLLPSTTHRVINPHDSRQDVSRYSIPFFLHPNSGFLIKSLEGCVGPDRPDRYPEPILADDYLKQRLREIGLA